ncbi:putative membrane protein YdbT with pleckstrin-like domain [Agromyces hippuratus]|uniref:Putative membrane protein YdbT with pleckstrin-like domain n=1 Tax=Agromyces hippuratus TaxID=286438 RepID=A0A852X3C0_9MICO|nr:PH domain-containing protein [Agromyces hippuratus]NYG20535.1 putative membrane protein YdbT with pleckstrin-like domain [Agromyces hippuratus]
MSPAVTPESVVPAAQPPERVVARVRRHARVLILPAILLIAVAGAAAYGASVVPETWQVLAVIGGALLVVLLGSFLPFLAWLTRRTTITTRRVIGRSGIWVRVRQEMLLSRGRDVTVRRTWGQGAFGSGDVQIDTGHEKPFVLKDVPKPELVQGALQELMGEEQSRVAERRRAEQTMLDGDTVAWGGR